MTAFDPLGWLWLAATLGGALLLGLAIAFGAWAFRRRARGRDPRRARDGRTLYHEGGPPKMDD